MAFWGENINSICNIGEAFQNIEYFFLTDVYGKIKALKLRTIKSADLEVVYTVNVHIYLCLYFMMRTIINFIYGKIR